MPPPLPPPEPEENLMGIRQRTGPSFSKVEEEADEKAPFSWEFRTALIAMTACLPVFGMILFLGNLSFLAFSLPLILIGFLTGLAFRIYSRPWAIPMTSLMTAVFTMFLAEVLISILAGAAWTGLNPFLYVVTMLTLDPFELVMDAMTHAMGGWRGYVAGTVAAFWLACND